MEKRNEYGDNLSPFGGADMPSAVEDERTISREEPVGADEARIAKPTLGKVSIEQRNSERVSRGLAGNLA